MKLTRIAIRRYKSVREETADLGRVNVFIGGNGAGKGTILDALRFLQTGVAKRDFRAPVSQRGGMGHLGWKGEVASEIRLDACIEDGGSLFGWSVSLVRQNHAFHITEQLTQSRENTPPTTLLYAESGSGWWQSGNQQGKVSLRIERTGCALAAAAADASFPARQLERFINRWRFFDPSPVLLRRDVAKLGADGLDPYGRNLAETLHRLSASSPETLERIVQATRDLIGTPSSIETRESEGRFHFVLNEPGLESPVPQFGVSSGTLRMLALMTTLIGEPGTTLIGIEEPENYVHPTALPDLVNRIHRGDGDTQFMVTTHSPLFLDYLDDPSAVHVVRRDGYRGTSVTRQNNLGDVRRAMSESSLSLGQYHETLGFGVD